MKASELSKKLQEYIQKHGDYECCRFSDDGEYDVKIVEDIEYFKRYDDSDIDMIFIN